MNHEDDVLAGVDLAAKASLTSGRDMWSTAAVPQAGIASVRLSDGPMGIASGRVDERDVATVSPCGTALGASWDTALVARVGAVIAQDARRLGVDAVLAPNLNLPRSPLVGRAFEMLSEDAHLAGEIGAAWIGGLQAAGVSSVAKHLVCNDSETNRDSMSAVVDARALRELYLAPFERAAAAGCAGMLTAYNRLNGTHCVQDEALISGIVKGEWGFPGFVVSDWFGTRETIGSARAGLDLDMPGPDRFLGQKFAAAVAAGEVAEDRLNDAAGRVARAALAVARRKSILAEPRDSVTILIEGAAGGFVLLRNEGSMLPLDPAQHQTIAVIGPNATAPCFQGGTFAKVSIRPDAVLPVAALRERFGAGTITYEPGVDPVPRLPTMPVTPARDLGDGCTRGMTVEFFPNHECSGAPAFAETRDTNSLTWFAALPGLGALDRPGAIRASGVLTAPVAGSYQFHIGGTGSVSLRLDGHEAFRRDGDIAPSDIMGVLKAGDAETVICALAAGQQINVVAELRYTPARAQGLWYGVRMPDSPAQMLERAVAAAGAADAVVLIVGETADAGVESKDRDSMHLEARQRDLIDRVCAANSNVVIVVNVGHAFDCAWETKARALLVAWYPGEAFGPALAQVLAGDREPGGRLPVTLARQDADYPAFSTKPDEQNDVHYTERHLAGYRGFIARGIAPRHAFGAGFGYAAFGWDKARYENGAVHVTLTNLSHRAGKAVVQVYVEGPDPTDEPATLRGFRAVVIDAASSATVTIPLGDRAFSHWEIARHGWAITPGRHVVRIGTSAVDFAFAIVVELP
jgi:beta-glucosidase